MSAITYPTHGNRGAAPVADTPHRNGRRFGALRRRWDDRPAVERNGSLSEMAIRSTPVKTRMYT
ncbi:MAG: hypothetical protein AAGD35_19870 [Actinomycetota bacterium]